MLYVYFGTDTHKVADKASKLVAGLVAKRPDAQIFMFEGASIEEGSLDELVGAQGLFVEKHIVVLKQPFETTEGRDIVLARIERFAVSQNIFVLSEGKLLAEHKRALTKHAKQIEEYKQEEKRQEGFNVFALGDALGARDKKKLWVGYVSARRSGLAPEAIHGTLHWALRGMLLAEKSRSSEESGQKPFVYSKFKRYAGNFSEGELAKFSRDLIELYHDARRGIHDLDTALERWILGV